MQEERAQRRNPWVWLREIVFTLLIAVAVSTMLRLFIVQVFWIPSSSMESTLNVNDRIAVSRISAWTGDIQRGDIVVFSDANHWLARVESTGLSGSLRSVGEFMGVLPADGSQILVKRVIGLPGDHVACEGNGAPVTVNGVAVLEDYIKPGELPSIMAFDQIVPAGHLWVMGDNRSNSSDSRFHQPQPNSPEDVNVPFVPQEAVLGTATAVIWPFDHWRTFDGRQAFSAVPSSGGAH